MLEAMADPTKSHPLRIQLLANCSCGDGEAQRPIEAQPSAVLAGGLLLLNRDLESQLDAHWRFKCARRYENTALLKSFNEGAGSDVVVSARVRQCDTVQNRLERNAQTAGRMWACRPN
jgi:hypothetical protein